LNTRISTAIRLALAALFVFTVTVGAAPPEVLTYRQAVRNAMDSSARIRVKEEDVHIAEALYRQSAASLYPELSLSGRVERYENLDRRAGQAVKTFSGEVIGGYATAWRAGLSLQGRYEVSNEYKKRPEVNYQEAMRDVRAHECAVEVKRLLRELTDAFGSAAGADIRLRYAGEILDRLREALVLKRRALAGGLISGEEVLRAETATASAEREIASITKEYRESLEVVCGLTGRVCSEGLRIEGVAPEGEVRTADFAPPAGDSPESRAKRKELEAARWKERAAEGRAWPDISLFGRYDYYGSDPGPGGMLLDIRETAVTAGVLISVPLFDGGAREWERKRSLFELRRQEEDVRATDEERRRDLRRILAGRDELSRALGLYRRLAEQYGKMLHIMRKARDLGERSRLDVLELEKDALAAERDWKAAEQETAVLEKRLLLESDFERFVREHDGYGACQH
jgi:adhesin transport system outer membrane protein